MKPSAIAENMEQMMHFLCDSLNKSQGTPPQSIKHHIYIKSLIHYSHERAQGWVRRAGMQWMKWKCKPETQAKCPQSFLKTKLTTNLKEMAQTEKPSCLSTQTTLVPNIQTNVHMMVMPLVCLPSVALCREAADAALGPAANMSYLLLVWSLLPQIKTQLLILLNKVSAASFDPLESI